MDISYFQSGATLVDLDSDDWEGPKSILQQIDLPHTCIIGTEDRGSRIALVLELEGERQDELLYPGNKFFQLTKAELTRDIFERAQRPLGPKREIIQGVFNHFQLTHEWPSSRQMNVELRHLGEYYNLAKGIGTDFIRTGEENDDEAISKLTIYGASLCSKAKEYLDTFLRALKFMVAEYVNNHQLPLVHDYELVDEAKSPYSNEHIIYEMITSEFGLVSGSTEDKSGEFTITISHLILKYEAVNTIEDYLRIAYYPRIWKQSEATIEPDSGGVLEFVGPEGIIVTGAKPATESKPTKLFEYDLFISYSSKDQSVADEVCLLLEKEGIKLFLAPKDIDSGDIGSEQIRQALLNSAEVAVLMSPNSINSQWVITEWGAAWVLRKRITPILLECKIDDIPKLLQDMQKRDYPSEIDRFIKEVLKRRTNAS